MEFPTQDLLFAIILSLAFTSLALSIHSNINPAAFIICFIIYFCFIIVSLIITRCLMGWDCSPVVIYCMTFVIFIILMLSIGFVIMSC